MSEYTVSYAYKKCSVESTDSTIGRTAVVTMVICYAYMHEKVNEKFKPCSSMYAIVINGVQ